MLLTCFNFQIYLLEQGCCGGSFLSTRENMAGQNDCMLCVALMPPWALLYSVKHPRWPVHPLLHLSEVLSHHGFSPFCIRGSLVIYIQHCSSLGRSAIRCKKYSIFLL